MTEYIPPPHVMSVLKTYQDKAPKSLHGPGLSLVHPSKSSASSSSAVRSETPDHHHHHHHHHHHQGDGGSGGHHHHHSRSDDEQQQQQQEQQQPPQHQSSTSTSSSSSPAQRVTIVPAPMVLGPPVPAVPIMTTPDPDCGIVNMTVLEGKRIGCFLLGGEMRLCLPQIFNNILMDFSVEQINRSIQELMIYLYNCTDQQLQEFKRANIIPETAKTCGLITRTNAERLCSSLLHQPAGTGTGTSATTTTAPGTSQSLKVGVGSGSFRVYHRCFGKCEGILTPELYSYDEPACIECCECRGLYSPQKFVCHQHEPQEIRTCHWGFDSSQWRLYIHVIDSDKNRDEHTQILQKIWNKEREIEQELAEYERELWIARRKIAHDDGALAIKAELQDIPLKKPKLMSDVASLYHSGSRHAQHNIVSPAHLSQHPQQTSSTFRPWAAQKAQKYAQQQQQLLLQQMAAVVVPYTNGTALVNGTVRTTSPGGTILALSQEPPLLQNPENVVPMSETDKFERSYQPNVALAPRKSILCKESSSSSASAPAAASGGLVPVRRDHHHEKESRSVIKCEVQIKQEHPSTPPAIDPSAVRSVIKCDVQIKQERPGTPPPAPPPPPTSHHHHHHLSGVGDGSNSPPPAHITVGPCSSPPPPPPPPAPAPTMLHHTAGARTPTAIAISTIIAKQQQHQQHQQQHVMISSMVQYSGSGGSSGSQSNSPVTVPPDVHSGSNEITSSTSPLPPPVNMSTSMNGTSEKQPKMVVIKEPLSPLAPTGRASPLSLRHSQQHALNHHHQQHQQQHQSSTSPSSPPHHVDHHQPLYLHHHPHHHHQHHPHHHNNHVQLHHRSHHVPTAGIIHKNGVPIVGNSEFELSTDTDDDSQAGEPDSSNAPSPIELIGEVLKEVEPETKQQIMDIFKVLLEESRMEHQRQQLEVRAKEDQLVEMQRQKDHLQQQVHQLQQELNRALLKLDSLRLQYSEQQLHQQQLQHKHADDGTGELLAGTVAGESNRSSSSTPPSPLSLVSNGSSTGIASHLIERRNSFPEKSEIIMKPLKKLLRRSPDEPTMGGTVLMLASTAANPAQGVATTPSPVAAASLSITATTTSTGKVVVEPSQPCHAEPMDTGTLSSPAPLPRVTVAPSKHPRKAALLSSSVALATQPPLTNGAGGSSQSPSPPSPQPPPPPTSASNVPASSTTTTTTNAKPPTAEVNRSISPTEHSPADDPVKVASVPSLASSTDAPPPPPRPSSPSPRPTSRPASVASPHENTEMMDAEEGDEEDEQSTDATEVKSERLRTNTSVVKTSIGITGSTTTTSSKSVKTSSTSSSGNTSSSSTSSNQENDSPNRANTGDNSDSSASSSNGGNGSGN